MTEQILKNLSTLKDNAKVFHTGKQLRACGLAVEGSDKKYHEHSVAELRGLLSGSPTVFATEPTDDTE